MSKIDKQSDQSIEMYKSLFNRELEKLAKQIRSFELESNIWVVKGDVNNSSGNLCLHLVGNLNNYIGHKLGGTNYVRDRKFEFEGKDVTRVELLEMIEKAKSMITTTFDGLQDYSLDSIYPEKVLGYEMSSRYFITHLLSHFSYHLGQIDYLRRLIDKF